MKLKLKSRNPSRRLEQYLKEHHHDMYALIRWDHLDHLGEIHGIAVKDIWAELQATYYPMNCTTAQFKERATIAADLVAQRAKEQANGENT